MRAATRRRGRRSLMAFQRFCYPAGVLSVKESFMKTKSFCLTLSLVAVAAFPLNLFAADKDKKEAREEARPSYETPQPERETLDLAMYEKIREEAAAHSHVMEYASGLMDGIGPRLTGSENLKKANEWTKDQLTAMGCSSAHLED